MSQITDTSGAAITSLDFGVRSGSPRFLTVRSACVAGKFLKCPATGFFAVSARLAGSGSAFSSIEGAGLDLTPWANTTQNFEIKVEATGAIGDEVEIRITSDS